MNPDEHQDAGAGPDSSVPPPVAPNFMDTAGPGVRTSPEAAANWYMYCYKVLLCPKRASHDWGACPYAHYKENARRRDPRQYNYSSCICPSVDKGPCPRGLQCPYAHGLYEYWLHPSRFRTQMCKAGADCKRALCFFAHTQQELRCPSRDSSTSMLLQQQQAQQLQAMQQQQQQQPQQSQAMQQQQQQQYAMQRTVQQPAVMVFDPVVQMQQAGSSATGRDMLQPQPVLPSLTRGLTGTPAWPSGPGTTGPGTVLPGTVLLPGQRGVVLVPAGAGAGMTPAVVSPMVTPAAAAGAAGLVGSWVVPDQSPGFNGEACVMLGTVAGDYGQYPLYQAAPPAASPVMGNAASALQSQQQVQYIHVQQQQELVTAQANMQQQQVLMGAPVGLQQQLQQQQQQQQQQPSLTQVCIQAPSSGSTCHLPDLSVLNINSGSQQQQGLGYNMPAASLSSSSYAPSQVHVAHGSGSSSNINSSAAITLLPVAVLPAAPYVGTGSSNPSGSIPSLASVFEVSGSALAGQQVGAAVTTWM